VPEEVAHVGRVEHEAERVQAHTASVARAAPERQGPRFGRGRRRETVCANPTGGSS
jgi:hypothetical protein